MLAERAWKLNGGAGENVERAAVKKWGGAARRHTPVLAHTVFLAKTLLDHSRPESSSRSLLPHFISRSSHRMSRASSFWDENDVERLALEHALDEPEQQSA
jgi:hypothetical protein